MSASIACQENRFKEKKMDTKKILFVVANPTKSELTGWSIGFWLAELAHPYYEFSKRGYNITIASPDGGVIKPDPMSEPDNPKGNPNDFVSLGFKTSPVTVSLMQKTIPISKASVSDYDAIFVVGGLSPMYTFIDNIGLQTLFASFYENGKVTAAICHGTNLLLKTKLSNGKLLSEEKRWTGFSNAEEDAIDKGAGKKVEPYRIEDEAKKILKTTFIAGNPFKPHAITDGNLVTGQQGNSGALTAEHVIALLEKKL